MTGRLSSDLHATFLQVVVIDISLAGDNAMVIGLAASGLPDHQRSKAIVTGITIAALQRIVFALATTRILPIPGLIFVGGLALLWVCWRMWKEARATVHRGTPSLQQLDGSARTKAQKRSGKTFIQAARQIVIADVSMSLDNVLAVAGAAHRHPAILVFALTLSVVLMGVAAAYMAQLLQRFHCLAYAGIVVVLYVAIEMVARGELEIWSVMNQSPIAS